MNLGKDVGVRAQVHLELPILGNVHLTPLEAEAVADQLRHMAWVARQTA